MPLSLELSEVGPWNYWWGGRGGKSVEGEGKDEWEVLE